MAKEALQQAIKEGRKETLRKKFEYHLERGSHPDMMREMGSQGWEAWAMMNGYTYFKREKID